MIWNDKAIVNRIEVIERNLQKHAYDYKYYYSFPPANHTLWYTNPCAPELLECSLRDVVALILKEMKMEVAPGDARLRLIKKGE